MGNKKCGVVKNEPHMKLQRVMRTILLIVLDCIFINAASFFALFIRFEFELGNQALSFMSNAIWFMPVNTVLTVAVFFIFKLYNSLWAYASMDEFLRILSAVLVSTIVSHLGMLVCDKHMPGSFPLLYCGCLMFFILVERTFYRFLRSRKQHNAVSDTQKKRTMLIGAGEAGASVLKEFCNSQYSQNKVVCFIDDNELKHGQYMHGVKIVGGRESIVQYAEKYNVQEIVIAIPTAGKLTIREIVEICKHTKCSLKIIPAIFQLVNGEVNIQQIRDVQVEDLLGRSVVDVDLTDIMSYVKDKTVLVTGGGGSIGSELCRQIAQYCPQRLIIFDIYENNAYEIQNELRREHPDLNLTVLIGSVRDVKRVESVFEKYRPDLVYHAAAHKHVPLMEDSPGEAIKNNVFGTFNVASAADKYKAKRMILVSTDKAVRPTNIMGASKRICEMIVQMINNRSKTEYVAVRFGNVLGSNGSVIPLFKEQIEHGGPVTVTHKDVIRYFMTIPEAVSLILQAGAYAKGGEIFVLDMGEPVKIDDLARNMIRLSGFEPDVDIEVVYTGLRPGEKLFEELLLDEEGLTRTPNNLIYIAMPLEIDNNEMMQKLDMLRCACTGEGGNVRDAVKSIVCEYHAERGGRASQSA